MIYCYEEGVDKTDQEENINNFVEEITDHI